MREVNVPTGFEIFLHLHPSGMVVGNFSTDTTNRHQALQLGNDTNIFDDQQRMLFVLKGKWRSGDEGVNFRFGSIPDEFDFRAPADNSVSLKGGQHRSSDNARLTVWSVTAALRSFIGMDTMENVTGALLKNGIPIRHQEVGCG